MNKTRYKFILLLIIVLFLIALIKAFYISIVNHKYYLKRYNADISTVVKQTGRRGFIYDSSGHVLALDYPLYKLFVDPNYYFKDIEFRIKHGDKDYKNKVDDFISRISEMVEKSPEKIHRIISNRKGKHFVVLAGGITLNEFDNLSARFIPSSFGFVKGYKRYYPDGEYSAHDVGFCYSNGKGADGLERYYNAYLQAKIGKNRVPIDAFGHKNVQMPVNGYNLYTSLNKNIQDFVHINLLNAIKKYDADSGIVIVMNPNSGSIIAMDSYPFYNNNKYYDYKYKYIKNRAVADVFEPGSVFKLITLSAAIDSGVFKGNEIIYCENGRWRLKRRIIHDVHRFKWLGFNDVFVHSSNIGAGKIALKLGRKIFYRYLIRFGFGKKTGIDTISESRGIVKDIFSVGDIDLANMAFGQGIGVTAIQLAAAYSVIANGGYRIKPHFMRYIKDSAGKNIYTYKTNKQRILKSSTVKKIVKILMNVVKRGTGKRASVTGYVAAGKTGTAQVPKKGSYKTKEYIASFAGFAPAQHPKIVVVVSIFNPKKGGFYGGIAAAPLFSKIVGFTLHYLAVKQDN